MAIMGSACVRCAMPTALEEPRQLVSRKQPSPDVGEHDAMLGIEEFDQSGPARRKKLRPEGGWLAPDEPSSGLHRRETAALADELVGVHRDEQPIILLGEHDLDTLRQLTDRHYVMDAGLRIATGATTHVLADPAVRRAYQGQPSAGRLAR